MKNIIYKIGIFVGLAVLIVHCTGDGDSDGNRNQTLQSILEETAVKMNENLPRTTNQGTRIDSVSTAEMTIIYNNTLIDSTLNNMDREHFENEIKPNLIQFVCTSDQLDVFIDNGITVNYNYFDKTGKQFTEIKVSQVLCAAYDSSQ